MKNSFEVFVDLSEDEKKKHFELLIELTLYFYDGRFGPIISEITPAELQHQIEKKLFNIDDNDADYVIVVTYANNVGQEFNGNIIIITDFNDEMIIKYELIDYTIFLQSAMKLDHKYIKDFLNEFAGEFYETFAHEVLISKTAFLSELTRLKLKYS